MSERWPDGGGEELDPGVIAHDDLLLDALGRGGPVVEPDDVTALLAAWHADVTAGDDTVTPLSDTVTRPSDGVDDTATWVGAAAPHTLDPAPRALGVDARPGVAHVRAGTPDRPARLRPARGGAGRGGPGRRPFGRRAARLAATALAALVLVAGLGVGTRNAGPASPLWALTKVLHPERAEVLAIEHTIGEARAAVAAGRFDDARQLIDRAARDLARVTDPTDVARLRAEIDGVRRDLAAVDGCPTWPRCASTSPVPTRPSPATSAAGTPAVTHPPRPRTTAPRPVPAAPAPAPSPTSSSGSGPLPPLPLPSVLGPSVLPSLPGLPLPTGDLLG
ncbi:anti-sigma-D factor RsdA [Micromonospora mangrovi]|uniref:Anti-sigma-D factor RsdA n=2 Tax=Micromonospora TaxID=1873 RepID=A0AAU8HJU2_9ACTN